MLSNGQIVLKLRKIVQHEMKKLQDFCANSSQVMISSMVADLPAPKTGTRLKMESPSIFILGFITASSSNALENMAESVTIGMLRLVGKYSLKF